VRMRTFSAPPPQSRISVSLYADVRAWLLASGPDGHGMLEWSSREVGVPDSPERMAGEAIWVILCAGRNAQAARTIEKKVLGSNPVWSPSGRGLQVPGQGRSD